MPTKALTQADVNMAKLLVLVADDLDEPLASAFRERPILVADTRS